MGLRERYEIEDAIKTEVNDAYNVCVAEFSKRLLDIIQRHGLQSGDENVRNAIVRLVGYDMLDSFDSWRNDGRVPGRS